MRILWAILEAFPAVSAVLQAFQSGRKSLPTPAGLVSVSAQPAGLAMVTGNQAREIEQERASIAPKTRASSSDHMPRAYEIAAVSRPSAACVCEYSVPAATASDTHARARRAVVSVLATPATAILVGKHVRHGLGYGGRSTRYHSLPVHGADSMPASRPGPRSGRSGESTDRAFPSWWGL